MKFGSLQELVDYVEGQLFHTKWGLDTTIDREDFEALMELEGWGDDKNLAKLVSESVRGDVWFLAHAMGITFYRGSKRGAQASHEIEAERCAESGDVGGAIEHEAMAQSIEEAL